MKSLLCHEGIEPAPWVAPMIEPRCEGKTHMNKTPYVIPWYVANVDEDLLYDLYVMNVDSVKLVRIGIQNG